MAKKDIALWQTGVIMEGINEKVNRELEGAKKEREAGLEKKRQEEEENKKALTKEKQEEAQREIERRSNARRDVLVKDFIDWCQEYFYLTPDRLMEIAQEDPKVLSGIGHRLVKKLFSAVMVASGYVGLAFVIGIGLPVSVIVLALSGYLSTSVAPWLFINIIPLVLVGVYLLRKSISINALFKISRYFFTYQELVKQCGEENYFPYQKIEHSILGYPFQVDYDWTVEKAIEAWERAKGKVNSKINNDNFRTKRSGTADLYMKFIPNHHSISSKEARREMAGQGLRPAELHEFLAFRRAYPDVLYGFPFVILNSVWRDSDRKSWVPYTVRNGRCLGLGRLDNNWDAGFQFVGVRERV